MAGEPEGDVDRSDLLDPVQIGFMCGLEVHQQLATGKLHSRQTGELYDVTVETLPAHWPRFTRKLRASRGEGGAIDIAARFEAKRNRSFIYAQSPNSGLIELDEQPPVDLDVDAVDISLTVAALIEANPVSLIQTMRKTVVDGSNTSGFQRTSLIATGGVLQTVEGPVGVDVLCLEEDSARKLDTIDVPGGQQVLYNLDRLGLPLIEIATSPEVQTPEHAKSTAIALGRVLRQTRRVRRGLGSIRQDLNVSIGAGDRVEIKGCQDLDWIPRIIRLEMARQLHFYRLANDLRVNMDLPSLPSHRDEDDADVEQQVAKQVEEALPWVSHDVTDAFSACDSKMIQEGLNSGSRMIALPLPGLKGKLGVKAADHNGAQLPRLGRELAGAAKLAGVKGIFHADELPAYGITDEEVTRVRTALDLNEEDGFVLCCAPPWQAELALEAALNRARLAWHRIPQEVRNVVVKKGSPEDGTTAPMRPLPGRSRMYPETDVPPQTVTTAHWNNILENLPMSDKERAERLSGFEISNDQASQLLARELDDVFWNHVEGVPAKGWASLLLVHDEEHPALLVNVLKLKEDGLLSREHVESVIENHGGQNPSMEDLSSYCEANQLAPADVGGLADVIDKIIAERLDFVKERGMGAMGPLMGIVMQAAGGADGKEVSALLRAAIQSVTE